MRWCLRIPVRPRASVRPIPRLPPSGRRRGRRSPVEQERRVGGVPIRSTSRTGFLATPGPEHRVIWAAGPARPAASRYVIRTWASSHAAELGAASPRAGTDPWRGPRRRAAAHRPRPRSEALRCSVRSGASRQNRPVSALRHAPPAALGGSPNRGCPVSGDGLPGERHRLRRLLTAASGRAYGGRVRPPIRLRPRYRTRQAAERRLPGGPRV